ncbi:hypothetical protein HDU81_009064 [Chytriomyces hyalinus]|nr:hypothetical protein HDU81_009064 [Chytriomyces hyalinus]
MKVAVAAPAPGSPPPAAGESRPPFEPIFEPNAKPLVQAASLMNISAPAAVAVPRPESIKTEVASGAIADALVVPAAAAAPSATRPEPAAKPSSEPPSKEEDEQQQTRANIKKPAAVSNNAAAAASESVVKQVEHFVATPAFLASAAGSLVVLCGVFFILYRRRKRRRNENAVPPLLPQTQDKQDNDSSISRSSSFKATAAGDANSEAGVDLMQNGSENVQFGSMRGLDGSNNSFTSESFGRKKAVDDLKIFISVPINLTGKTKHTTIATPPPFKKTQMERSRQNHGNPQFLAFLLGK